MKNYLQIKTKCRSNYVLFSLLVALFILYLPLNRAIAGNIEQQNISIKLKNATIKEFLLEFNKQSRFDVVYNNEDVQKETKRLTINYANASVAKVLEECLNGTALKYRIENNSVIIYKGYAPAEKNGAEKVLIKGRVVDQANKPISGATIIITGTQLGAISDGKGEFVVITELDRDVEVSFVGFKNKIVKLSNKNITIKLEPDVMAYDDVIITGYGNVRKESFTGNVTTVQQQDLLKTNNRNVIAALQAFDPSFRIKENSIWGSDPNKLPEFNIRGESSIAAQKGLGVEMDKRTQRVDLQNNPNLPIFMLDGFEVGVQKIYDMDINRIQSMTILKDAAATAMYGSRAANGVIVVTSVPPKPGQLQVNYNFSGGAVLPDLSDYNLCNAAEKLELERAAGLYEASYNAGQIDKDILYNNKLNLIKRGVDTDWMAIPLRNVFNHTHSISVTGGEESIRYGIDLNYDSNNGAMKDSHRSRIGAGLSLDYRMGKWLQLTNYISFSNTSYQDSPFGDYQQYSQLQPYNEIYDADGELIDKMVDGETNPLWVVRNTNSYSGKGAINDLTNNFCLNLFFNDYLSLKTRLGITKNDTHSDSFKDPKDPEYAEKATNERGMLRKNSEDKFKWSFNAMLLFNKQVKNHFFNATASVDLIEDSNSSTATKYDGFQLGSLNKPSFAAMQKEMTSYNSYKSRLIGLVASLNYTYNNIYLLDASYRLDGSSQFGENNRFASFWSTGVGINIHKYEWMQGASSVLSELKLRATYGSVGNVSFPSYSAITTYAMSTDGWYYTGPASSLIYLGNPSLTWQTTNTLDAGIKLGLFNDRIGIDVSYYNKDTRDLIDEISIRQSSGFSKYYSNTGSVVNKGYEVKFNAVAFRNKDWLVSLNANINGNQNRITELGKEMLTYNETLKENYDAVDPEYPELAVVPLIQYYVGASTTAIYAVPSYGIDPANGRELFRKKNGNSSYVWSSEDQIVVGDTNPKAQGSFGINLAYKGFYLNTSFLFQWGSQMYNETLLNKVENAKIATSNVDKRVITERWRKPGDLAPYYDLNNTEVTKPTSRFVQDYDYLNFSSLSCGYDFQHKTIKKLGLTSLGIRFNMNDLTRWSSVRVERGTSYPYAKNYSFTINIGF